MSECDTGEWMDRVHGQHGNERENSLFTINNIAGWEKRNATCSSSGGEEDEEEEPDDEYPVRNRKPKEKHIVPSPG